MIIDLVIILLLCVYSFVGFKKGLLLSILSIVSLVLSVYLSYLLLPMFSNFVVKCLKIDALSQNYIKDNPILLNLLGGGRFAEIIKPILGIDTNMGTVTEFIVKIFSFIVLCTILRLIFKSVLKHLAVLMQNTLVFNTLDRMSGLCFGFIKGVVIVGILCVVVVALSNFDNFNAVLSSQISSSSLLYVFSDGAGSVVETIAKAIFA